MLLTFWSLNTAEARAEERQISITRPTIAAGRSTSFVIQENGSLWGWGWNSEGQVGFGIAGGNQSYPVWIMDDVVAVSAGDSHTMAIRSDGTLWGWGNNEHGRIGDGTVTIRESINIIENNNRYYPVFIMDNVIAVSACIRATLAIRNDGSLWHWGNYGWSGGRGSILPVRIASDAVSLTACGSAIMADGSIRGRIRTTEMPDNAIYFSTGYWQAHSMAITADNNLWGWGSNQFGRIGDGTATIYGEPINNRVNVLENNDRDYPVRIMDDVAIVSTGNQHTVAIRYDGTLWSWGDGRLVGNGDDEDQHSPVKIMENMVAVVTGEIYTMALRNDGALWGWGANGLSQLGTDTIGHSDSPMLIIENVMLPHIEIITLVPPAPIVAEPTASRVLINNEEVAFQAYHIEGHNFFRLRDIAYALNGTVSQFNVGWDGVNNAITLTTGEAYEPVGGEMVNTSTVATIAISTNAAIFVDGVRMNFTAYHINGNNYFMLRDLGRELDFFVQWDHEENAINIFTPNWWGDLWAEQLQEEARAEAYAIGEFLRELEEMLSAPEYGESVVLVNGYTAVTRRSVERSKRTLEHFTHMTITLEESIFTMIRDEVALQEARRLGLQPSQERIDEYLAMITEMLDDADDWELAMFIGQGVTREEFLAAQKELAYDMFLREALWLLVYEEQQTIIDDDTLFGLIYNMNAMDELWDIFTRELISRANIEFLCPEIRAIFPDDYFR